MESIYSMGTHAWRQSVTFWTNKIKDKADLIDGKIPESQLPEPEPPKWLYYKALLTQSGENAPVARVLNRDEPDYFGDIVFLRNEAGVYTNLVNSNSKAIPSELSIITLGKKYDRSVDIRKSLNGFIQIETKNGNDELSDNVLNLVEIEISVRQRGTSPVLLSAETNTTGDKIILTFDKKMNNYALIDKFTLSDTESESPNITAITTIDNIIEIELESSYTNATEISVSSLDGVESFDYGLLAPFENVPVVNNVVEPE